MKKKELLLTSDSGRRIAIESSTNSMNFFNEREELLVELKDDITSFQDDDAANTRKGLGGMNFRKHYSSNPSNPDEVQISGNGIYSNTGFAQAKLTNNPGLTDTAFGSVIGYVRRAITLAAGNIHAAIVGLANTNNSYGGYFKHMSGGTALRIDGKIQLITGTSETATLKTGSNRTVSILNAAGIRETLTFVNGVLVD